MTKLIFALFTICTLGFSDTTNYIDTSSINIEPSTMHLDNKGLITIRYNLDTPKLTMRVLRNSIKEKVSIESIKALDFDLDAPSLTLEELKNQMLVNPNILNLKGLSFSFQALKKKYKEDY